MMKNNKGSIIGGLGLGTLLLLSACSDNANDAETEIATAGDPDQTTFVLQADQSCSKTREEIDGLLAFDGDAGDNPQPVVEGIAAHFNELYDQISAIEGLEPEVLDSTESYLTAVLAAAEEADDAAATPDAAAEYLGSNPEALIAVNDAGKVLGIESCEIQLSAT